MSMFAGLCATFGDKIGDLYDVSAADPSRAIPILRDESLCVYTGHFSFGFHEWLTRPCYYLAMVRAPVERVLSLYGYMSTYRKVLRQSKHMPELAPSLRPLPSGRRMPDFFADYVDWIDGADTLRNFLGCRSAELDNGMVRRFSGHGLSPERCPDSALEVAKRNIESSYSVVGITERFPETVRKLRDTFLWDGLDEFKVNESAEKVSFSAAARDFIAARNTLDVRLYAWINERFDKASDRGPIVVPPGRREDYQKLVLWRAVGTSPVREQAKLRQGPMLERRVRSHASES
jgi:hypothetical protein